MKLSLNWLSEYVDLTLDPDSLSSLLTMAGIEVEGVTRSGADFPHVVVAQILSSDPHPDADRLSVCRVDDGGGAPRQIVCGAKNYKVGDKIPLALPGAVLPGDFKIKKGKLRGVESEGMMCSAKELQLAADADGLLILPADSRVGAPMAELFPSDTVFDIEVTPNRPDLLSHIGVAREISALTGHRLVLPEPGPDSDSDSGRMPVTISDSDRCPLYSARLIRGVRVAPSPAWLVHRLESAGLRPINNIVDVTNFVLLETGQPLHAFDASTLHGGIEIRRAAAGEVFPALDGKSYPLNTDDLVIADANRPVALAGVMGGEQTGVTDATTEVLLESAQFLPSTVRRTSRRLGLISDSSYRFERGVDRQGVLRASQRAVSLILELAGGTAEPGISISGGSIPAPVHVNLRGDRCRSLLGAPIDDDEISRILIAFGLSRIGGDNTASTWSVPSHRLDLTREIDLIEEVARVHGLDRIPRTRRAFTAPESAMDRVFDFSMAVRRRLQGAGFHEARTLTLLSESMLADDCFGDDNILRVKNPLGEDSAALRPSLVPGLVKSAAFNVRQGTTDIRIFELGRVFHSGVPEESTKLALLLHGAVLPEMWREKSPRPSDFYDLKGVLSQVVPALHCRPSENSRLPLCAEVLSGETPVGWIGQVWPARARELDLNGALLVTEIDMTALYAVCVRPPSFSAWPKFPSTRRDIAMVVSGTVTHRQIVDILRGAREPLLSSIEVFDVFTDPTGEKVPMEMKSVGYALTYRAADRTLTSEEVTTAHAALKDRLQTRLGAQLRE